jgi:hypothetical protein
MTEEKYLWVGVSPEKNQEWHAAFAGQDLAIISNNCPICGKSQLRQYYHIEVPGIRSIHGRAYLGKGSYWAWCKNCHAYEHASCFVPETWAGPILQLDLRNCGPTPTILNDLI